MGRVTIFTLYYLLALVAVASAGPMQRVSIDTCARTCTDSNKFHYTPGNSYEYVYRSHVKTSMTGADSDEAGVIMTATVNLDVLSKCELSMRMSDVKLEELDPNNAPTTDMSVGFARPLEKNPLRVAFQDGQIEQLCTTAEEPIWVLNVKRGVISLIQNNMDDFAQNKTVTESDVSGECVTNYEVAGSGWYTTTVRKTKDLLGCRGRQEYNSAMQGIPYTSDSGIQSLPIVKSELECSHDVDTQSGLLKTITCTESHVLRPFSNANAGAVTTNTQTLKYIRETRGIRSPAGIYEQGVSLKFKHDNSDASQADPAKNLKVKLQEICQKTRNGVKPETPALFTSLIYLVKSADADTLEATYKLVDGKAFCTDNRIRTRKFFLDALPMAGTSASLHLMTSLITKNTVTGAEAESWISSIAFIKNPTQDMLKEVKPLLNMPGVGDKAMLAVGTLIHNYCDTQGGCTRDYMATALISAIENQMAKKCKVTPANKKLTLMALRGLGNAGYAQRSVPTLEACIDSPLVEIKLSAIDAFRRMPCTVDRSKLERVFLDEGADAELRIAAYRALMQCPSQKILTVVKNALEREQVNQVGSYVWTHLTNLMETSDRHKQDIRAILEDATFKKEFDLDKRKFSRNYEGSFFLDALNTGAKVEGDLIWSSKSFIPRSSMVNLTVELFGNSVNLFEMGGRVEGLEYLLESFFGPSGYFSQKNTPVTKDVAPKSIHMNKMKKLDSRFGATKEQLSGSAYMRVFGNELKYVSFDSLQSLLTASDVNFLDMLVQLANDNHYTYSHSSMFLDSSIIIPTSSGFPLNLTINGTSTVDLRMKGKMDLRTPPNVVIEGLIQPSAAIDISTMMSVDAFVTRPGIKMVSTLHSSTAVQGKIIVKDDGSISAEYDMPQPKMEIIDVKTSFFTVHTNKEREQKMITDNRQTVSKCSPRGLIMVTGLELCTEVAYPNASIKTAAPYFPFTGPVSAGVYLYKRDTHTKYTMNIKSIHNKKNNILHFSVNTPGSRTDRHILGDITIDKAANTADLTVRSPWMSADIQGTITNDKNVKGLMGKMSIDGRPGYVFDAKLVKDRVKNAYRFTPTLDITLPSRKPISLQGMFMYNGNRQFDVDFNMKGVTQSPVSASATIINKPVMVGMKAKLELVKGKPYSIDAKVSTQTTKKKIVYNPFLSVRSPTTEVLAFGGSMSNMYNKKIAWKLVLDKCVEKKVELNGFVSTLAKRRGRNIYRTVFKAFSGPADVQLNAKVDNRNYRTIATDIDLTYVIRRVARNKIKLISKIQDQSSAALKKGKATLNLDVKRNPELNLKMLANIDHSKKQTVMDLDMRYGADFKNEQKHIDMAFEMNRKFKSVMDASGDIMIRGRHPGMGLNVNIKGNHKHTAQDLDTNVQLRFGKGSPIQSSLRMWERWEQQRKVSSEFLLTYPGRNLVLNQTMQGTNPDKIVSIVNVQLQKGQKNSITTTIDMTKADNVKVASDWLLYAHTPTHLEGEFQLNPKDFITSFAVTKNSKTYAGSVRSQTIDGMGSSSNLSVTVENPTRKVILELDGRQKSDALHAKANLMWNAAANKADRVTIAGWIKPATPELLDGSISLSYPSRTLILNANFKDGKKTSAYADFQWATGQKISIDTTFGVTSGSVFGQGAITTPWAIAKKLDIELSHNNDKDEYKTDIKMKRNTAQSVSVTTVLKKPMSLHTFVAYFIVNNNFAQIKNLRLDIDHKLSNSLASSGKFKWNRQQVQLDIVLQNTTKPGKFGIKGDINIKTTLKSMKKGMIGFSHTFDGSRMNTNAKFIRNKKSYSVTSKITHSKFAYKYENSGTVDISLPTNKYTTSWSHSHALKAGKIDTTYSTTWGKKSEIALKLDASYKNAFDATFKLNTPFKTLQSLQVMSSMSPETGAKLNLMKDDKLMAASEVGYQMDNTVAKAEATLQIPDLDVDSRLTANYENRDMTASLSAVITPEMTASLDFKSGLVLWKSTYPGAEQIRYTYEINDAKQLDTIQTLEYSDGKIIRLHTSLQLDLKAKRGFLELTTPFQSLNKFSTGLNFIGDLESFTSDGFIEMHPGFDKISAEASYNSKVGVSGKVHIKTPLEDFRYFKADFSGKLEPTKDAINVQIEYQPRKIVKFELEGERDTTKSMMMAKLTVPSTTISVEHKVDSISVHSAAALELYGKKYEVDLDHRNAQKMNSILTINLPSRRPIIITISHEGGILDFKTRAEINHNRKNNFASDISFKATDTLAMNTRTTLQSEMLSNEEYTVVANFNGSPKQFTSRAEFASNSLGKSTAEVSLNTERDISGNVAIMSPHMKNIKGSFSHFYNPGFLQTRGDLIYGGKKMVNLDTSLKSDQSIVGEFTLQQPFKMLGDISGLVRFDGVKDNFALHAEGSIADKKAEVEYISRYGQSFVQQTITIKATGMKDITAELSLTKSNEYKGYGEIRYGVDKHRLDVTFSNLKSIEGGFSLESPFVDPVTANFNYEGEPTNFMSSVDFSISQKKSEIQVMFQATRKGSISITSPYMYDFTASYDHRGQLPDIVTKAKMAYGREVVDAEFTMTSSPKLSTSFTLLMPNAPYKRIYSAASIDSSVKACITKVNFGLDQDNSELLLTLQKSSSLEGSLTITSPYMHNLDASFQHNGQIPDIVSKAKVSYGKEMVDAELTVTSTPKLSTSITILTSMSSMPRIQASASHEMKTNGFKTHADYNFGSDYESNFDLTFNKGRSYKGLMTVTSHLIPDISASFEHSGRISDFKSSTEVTYDGKTHKGGVSFSNENDVDAHIDLSSPLMDTFEFNLHESLVSHSELRLHADMKIGHDKSDADLTLSWGQSVGSTFTLTTPYTENIRLTLNHAGPMKNFVTNAEIIQGSERSVGTVTFNLGTDSLTTSITTKTPYADITMKINHNGQPMKFTTTGEMTIDGSKADFNIKVNLIDSAELTATVSAPDFDLRLNHNGMFPNFASSADLTSGTDVYSAAASLRADNDVTATITMTSPITNFESFKATYTHTGIINNFKCHMEVETPTKSSVGDLTVNKAGAVLDVSYPKMKVKLLHKFVPNRLLEIESELTAMDMTYTTNIALEKKNNDITAKIDMTSPIKDLESFRATYTHTGTLTNFKCNMEVETPTKSSVGHLTVNEAGALLDVSYPKMKVKFLHKFVPNRLLETEAELSAMDMTYTSNIILKKNNNDISATIDMTSPITYLESFRATYTHTGTINNFNCHMEVNTPRKSSIGDLTVKDNGIKLDVTYPKMKVEFNYDMVPNRRLNIDAELTVLDMSYTSAIKLQKDAEMKQGSIELKNVMEGDHMKLSGSLQSQYMKEKKALLDLTINDDHSEVEASLSVSPKLAVLMAMRTVYFPHIEVSADVSGNQVNSEILINGERKGKLTVEAEPDDKHVSLTLMTPFTNFTSLKVDAVYKVMDLSNIETSFVFTLEGDNIVDTGLTFTNAASITGDAHFNSAYLHPISATFMLEKDGLTHQANFAIMHDNSPMFTTIGKLTFLDNLLNSDGSIKVIVTEFAPVTVGYSMENSPEHIKYHIETIILNNAKYEIDAAATNDNKITEASFSVKLPDMDSINGHASYKKKFSRYLVNADLELDAMTKYEYDMNLQTRSGLNGKITITTPVEGMRKTVATLSHAGTLPNINTAVSVTSDGKTMFGSVDLSHSSSQTSGTMKFASPFESYENIEASIFCEGSWSNLKAGGKLSYVTGQAIEMNVEHMLMGTTLKSKISISSPYTNEISMSANHTGDWSDFTSSYALTMGPDNSIRSDTTFKTGSQYLSLTSTMDITMTGRTTTNVVELKHDGSLEKFRTEAKLQNNEEVIELDTSFQLKPVIEGSIELMSPWNENMKVDFSHSGNMKAFLTKAEVQYAPKKKISGKLDVLIHDLSRMDISAEVTTPFQGYKTNKVTYHHSGSTNNFQCETSVNVASQEFSSTMTGKVSPPNFSINIKTPFTGYRNMDAKLNININQRLGRFGGRFEGSWAPSKTIVAEVILSNTHNKLEGSAVLSTPFELARRASAEFSHQILQDSLMQVAKVSLNGQSMLDVETDFNLLNVHKHARVIIHAPLSMKYELEGDFTLNCVDIDATAILDTKSTGKTIKLECGYDIREDNTAHFKLTGKGQTIEYKGQFLPRHASSELSLDLADITGKYGFDISPSQNGGVVKVMLPTRTLALTGTMRSKVIEGSFMWDADRDQTKKVELRSVVMATKDSVKLDMTVNMPSLRKQVQLGSEVVVNRGRVIFEGKTELSYSKDERQKLLLSTKLEDVSTGNTKNYSFSMGVSHPYSTIGVKLASHLGKSLSKYSAGMGVEYLTARRQTKTFQVNGMINKLRKTVSFELQSPVKSISIASSMKMDRQFEVSMTNSYDQRVPLYTTLTVNPDNKGISFVTNYDLDNPRNAFHVQLGYINSKKWEAEVYRKINGEHITDAIAALTLNNSRLLHTRLHWRPEALNELKAYEVKKLNEYRIKSAALMGEIEVSVLEELAEKAELIWDELEQQLGPVTMAKLRERLTPLVTYAAEEVQGMVRRNYNSYLMPVAAMASSANLQYTSFKPEAYLSKIPSMPSFKFDMFMEKPTLKLDAVKKAILPRFNSTKWDSYLDIIISTIEKEIDIALKDFSEIAADWETIVYDPAHGEIQVEFHLPIPLKSLDEMPVVNVDKYIRQMKKSIPDTNKFDTGMLTGEWVPPFTGVASVKSGHQITTFDGYVYDLPLDCTFVLARDYTDGNFSLIMSNADDTTLTLMTEGPTVEISIEGGITVGGNQLTDTPYINKGLKIYMLSNNTATIKLGDHLTIEYDLSIDHATVSLSGWYHGKTGGLLGTYDNEPSNDMMTSFGKVNSNMGRFAKTWDVGTKSC